MMSVLPFLFNTALEVLDRAIRKRKGIKIGKENVKPYLFLDDIIKHIGNTKESREILDLVSSARLQDTG